MRPRPALVLGLMLILAACTETTAQPTPTAPPGVFAPTPSIQGESAPSTIPRTTITTIDEQRASLYPVDPLTLEGLTGFEPMATGDWVWAYPSEDGSRLAATSGDDDSNATEILLIDLTRWEQVSVWSQPWTSGLTVTNEGVIYYIGDTARLESLRPGSTTPESLADLPADFGAWGMGGVDDGRFEAFGNGFDEAVGLESAVVIAADVGTGVVTEIELPGVRIGSLEPGNGEPWSGYLWASPGFVIDEAGDRVLVIHTDRDLVTEVDLLTGSLTDHEFYSGAAVPGAGEPARMSLGRQAVLGSDGTLYVATQEARLEVSHDQSWSFTWSPAGVTTIDTNTWETVSHLDEPIGEVYLAPDGVSLVGVGGFSSEDHGASGDSYENEPSGWYFLRGSPPEVIAHHAAEPEETGHGSVSFNRDAGVGYVHSRSDYGSGEIEVIDLASGALMSSVGGDLQTYQELFGAVSVMSSIANP